MEAAVEKLLTPGILETAANSAGAGAGELKKLGDFENYVYEFATDAGPHILRLSHSSHRSTDEVLAELDMLRFLGSRGIRASQPVALGDVDALELPAADGSYFTACVFQKGNGTQDFALEPEILHNWGRITGRMHRETKDYTPTPGIQKRFRWKDDIYLNDTALLQLVEPVVMERLHKLIGKIGAISETRDNFGLIHTDLHQSNFVVDGHEITAFDFDDCCYHYFVQDIAMPLYYARWRGYGELSEQEFVHYFLQHFMAGYATENTPPEGWLQQLPLFMDVRSIVLYLVFTKKVDVAKLSGPGLARYEGFREQALGRKPLLGFELEEIEVGTPKL